MELAGSPRYGSRNHDNITMNEIKVNVVLTNTDLNSFFDILTSNRKIVPMITFIIRLNGCASERRRAAVATRGKYTEFILVKMK
jgi:hypothetical protein